MLTIVSHCSSGGLRSYEKEQESNFYKLLREANARHCGTLTWPKVISEVTFDHAEETPRSTEDRGLAGLCRFSGNSMATEGEGLGIELSGGIKVPNLVNLNSGRGGRPPESAESRRIGRVHAAAVPPPKRKGLWERFRDGFGRKRRKVKVSVLAYSGTGVSA